VTLYIGCDSDSGVTVLRLEGWLEGEAVAELERVAHDSAGPIRLDLSGLRSADVAGLKALRALRTTGASLVGASPYMGLLLGSRVAESPCSAPTGHNEKGIQVPFPFNGTKLTFNLGASQLTAAGQRNMEEAVARARD
jgi:hypothetical protein